MSSSSLPSFSCSTLHSQQGWPRYTRIMWLHRSNFKDRTTVTTSRHTRMASTYICVIDQACSVKMAGYWPSSFLRFLWTETKSRSIKTQKRTRPISSHLDRTSLVNKEFIIWPKHYANKISLLRDQRGQSRAGKIGPSCLLG